MSLNKSMAAMLLVPIVGLTLPATVLLWKTRGNGLTRTEEEVLKFSSQPLVVARLSDATTYHGAENPIRPPKPDQATPAAFPPGPLPKADGTKSAETAKQAPGPHLSMIYSDNGSRMAIIDGQVLREGAVVNGHTIVKIEKSKVLARIAGKDLWLSIE
ncbi:hypothetical protein [Geobacter sp. SVR]|uniref:hypothetical protein n=1 Tax=Geobacter sp. SVR TaxID=2495594 RepID=UPI00143EF611|nr:hypothetical protein [Geobacter sp. SVR]BCS54712.1 hypothetical protein GSVR_30200 [Geobacter sp. SVR]GCF86480.1 hypothetical protein GSbR_30800 [Geobacter sp. SVR]